MRRDRLVTFVEPATIVIGNALDTSGVIRYRDVRGRGLDAAVDALLRE